MGQVSIHFTHAVFNAAPSKTPRKTLVTFLLPGSDSPTREHVATIRHRANFSFDEFSLDVPLPAGPEHAAVTHAISRLFTETVKQRVVNELPLSGLVPRMEFPLDISSVVAVSPQGATFIEEA